MNSSFDTLTYNRDADEAPPLRSRYTPAEIDRQWDEFLAKSANRPARVCDGASNCRRGWICGCGPGCVALATMEVPR